MNLAKISENRAIEQGEQVIVIYEGRGKPP